MKIIAYLVLICSILLRPSNQQCLTENDYQLPHPSGNLVLYSGQQEFSFALLEGINKINPNGNVFFSPYSTYHALVLAYFLSSYHTEETLKKILRLDPAMHKAQLFSAYKLDRLATSFRARNNSYQLTNANRIYVAQQIVLRDCLTLLFTEELAQKDFKSNPEKARTEINDLVEQNTNNLIKDLIPPAKINAATKLVFVAATHFNGQWVTKFDPKDTRPDVFFASPSKQIIVDMMHVESDFNYAVSPTLMAHILEMPYDGADISMYIFLPPFSNKDGLENLLKRLTLNTFQSAVNDPMIVRKVKVSLPRFRMEHTVELSQILETLGVRNFFQDVAILTGQRDSSVNAVIGMHKAKIAINEEGTRPAAVTAIFSLGTSSSHQEVPIEFQCNRPFVFLIYNKIMHTVLFAGVYKRNE